MQSNIDGGYIYSPLIMIEYGVLNKKDLQYNRQIEVNYKVTFVLSHTHENNLIKVILAISSNFP